jgi:two-component system, chemotaxis family, protein-glutamate methylesterase/glutaminase
MIHVVVVDDSGFMRIALRKIIEAEGDIRVVGEARDGEEALSLVSKLKPDIVTMDIEMPRMDGLAATAAIGELSHPRPTVIMVSNRTQEGAEATVRALSLGAVDFVSKSTSFVGTDLGHIDIDLRPKIRFWAERRSQTKPPLDRIYVPERRRIARPTGPIDLIVVAVSTGGPQVLPRLLNAMGPVKPPIAIAQHMPDLFTRSLAEFLSNETKLKVREQATRMALEPRSVTILQGGRDAVVAPTGGSGFEIRPAVADSTVHPSANLLFKSAAMVARRPVAVILTGMGDDGTEGAQHFKQRDLPVLVQTPESCIVWGMPSAAIKAGVATEILDVEAIGKTLSGWAKE